MKKLICLTAVFALTAAFAVAANPPAAPAKAAAPAPAAAPAKQAEPLDINTATLAQLKAIPAIGELYAQKIVDGRPYLAKKDLVSKKIMPQVEFNKIANLIDAKPVTPAAASKGAK